MDRGLLEHLRSLTLVWWALSFYPNNAAARRCRAQLATRTMYDETFPGTTQGTSFACGVRNYSAVTGACMMTRADSIERWEVTARELAVNFNDVDYAEGARKGSVYARAPIHMESLSHSGRLIWRASVVSRALAAELVLTSSTTSTFLPLSRRLCRASTNDSCNRAAGGVANRRG